MTIRINEATITENQILGAMQYHPASTPRDAMIKAAEALVIAELLRQRAETLGLDLKAKDDDGEPAYVDRLIDAEVAIPEASTEECQHYFEGNQEKFCTSPLIAASHVLLMCDPKDDRARVQAKQQAEQIIKELQANADAFADYAKRLSDCPSKAQGGSLGQLSKGQTVDEFERQVFNCQPGLIPYPVETRYGIHIIRIDHREEGRPLPFEMAEARIRDYLNEKVRRKAIAQYLQQLAGDATIEGFDLGATGSPLMQ